MTHSAHCKLGLCLADTPQPQQSKGDPPRSENTSLSVAVFFGKRVWVPQKGVVFTSSLHKMKPGVLVLLSKNENGVSEAAEEFDRCSITL